MPRSAPNRLLDHAQPARRRPADPRISVVVPALNEGRNLARLLPQLPLVHQVVLVDGRSVDDTEAVARRLLPAVADEVTVITQTRRGKGNALACGFVAATGDIVIMVDADGSADPAEFPDFVGALTAGADFAKGTRFSGGGGSDDITLLRRVGNRGLNRVANRLFGTDFTDLCYGYNAFWRADLDRLALPDPEAAAACWGDGFEIETVINCRFAAAGMIITEVPSRERARWFGHSHLRTFSDGVRVLRTLLTEHRRVRSTASRRARPTGGARRADLSLDQSAGAVWAVRSGAGQPSPRHAASQNRHSSRVEAA